MEEEHRAAQDQLKTMQAEEAAMQQHAARDFLDAAVLENYVIPEDQDTGEIILDELHTKIPEHRKKETEEEEQERLTLRPR